jgi:hypothetical protein
VGIPVGFNTVFSRKRLRQANSIGIALQSIGDDYLETHSHDGMSDHNDEDISRAPGEGEVSLAS